MTGKQWATILILLGILSLLCWANTWVFNSMDFSKLPTSSPSTSPTNTIPPTPTPLQYRKAGAIVWCRTFIKDRLTVPTSAKFSSEKDYSREGKPLNYHAVTGLVQSQNRFGVLLQANFRCDTHYLPDEPLTWILDKLELE